MWQVLAAAAAAAGSAILAKKLNPGKPSAAFSPNDQEHVQDMHSQSQDAIFRSSDDLEESTIRVKTEPLGKDEIFRFSSLEKGSREFGKSSESNLKRLKKNNIAKKGKTTNGGKGKVKVVDQIQRAYVSGKRVSVCLKKRRTSKFVAGKCETCASKAGGIDNSFNWGIGIGIMYMVSAGKIVQELKSEISRTKSSVAEGDSETNEMACKKSHDSQEFSKIDIKEKKKLKRLQDPLNQAGECASSVLTEDPQEPDVLEMDQLQAELEFELQKLPWCATESSGSEGRNDTFKAEDFVNDHQHGYSENSGSYPINGISPVELNQKLSTLLIEQQENQIVELESELQQAHRQLHEKEAELNALRDCVKSLTQLSLSSDAQDEEAEDDSHKRVPGVPGEHAFDESIVGMKRYNLDCESYMCLTI